MFVGINGILMISPLYNYRRPCRPLSISHCYRPGCLIYLDNVGLIGIACKYAFDSLEKESILLYKNGFRCF